MSLASIASKSAGAAAQKAASNKSDKITPAPAKRTETTGAVLKAGGAGKSVADTVASWDTSDDSGNSASKFSAPNASGSRAEQRVVRPAGGLNSDKFYERQAANGGKAPFEGIVDWGGIYDFLQAPADRRMARETAAREPVDITVRGGKAYDDIGYGMDSFGHLLDMIGTPEVSSHYLTPVAPQTVYYPPDGNYGYNALTGEYELKQPGQSYASNPLTPQERQALALIGGIENPALGGIEAAVTPPVETVLPELQEPSIVQSADAGDLFETDGRVMTPEGEVIQPGRTAPPNVFVGEDGRTYRRDFTDDPYLPGGTIYRTDGGGARGIDDAAAEPSAWDSVVDNTGKLLSNTGLGSIVSTLFPDMWNGIGGIFKGTGEPAGPVYEMSNWDRDRGTWKNNDGSEGGNGTGQPAVAPPPVVAFPDLNHNGIDDRLEGYTGPDTDPAVPGSKFGRKARFPNMPPYNPGRSDEWSYFTNNHLADGGMVYAEGGSIDRSDPKVQLIGATEDVLERIKAGEKPDESAAKTLKAFVAQFGDAALRSLNDNVGEGMSMKSGRLIKGPGGPKDDRVPAVIVEEGSVVSPAKLSNGEFVFSVAAVEGAGGPEALQELADRLSARRSAA